MPTTKALIPNLLCWNWPASQRPGVECALLPCAQAERECGKGQVCAEPNVSPLNFAGIPLSGA